MERVPITGNSGGRAPKRISGSPERQSTSLHGGPPGRISGAPPGQQHVTHEARRIDRVQTRQTIVGNSLSLSLSLSLSDPDASYRATVPCCVC